MARYTGEVVLCEEGELNEEEISRGARRDCNGFDFRCRIGAITVGGVILGKSSDERVPISPCTNVQAVSGMSSPL